MSTRKRKKKSIWKSRFYQVYFALVAVALIAIVIGTAWLRGVLADYESAQPVYVAEDVAKLFEDGNYERIYEADTSAAQFSGSDRALYLQSMRELAAGKTVEWSEAFSTDENERKYAVTLDGERFATFTLVPSGEKTRRGNRLWKLGSITTHVALTEQEEEVAEEPEAVEQPQEPQFYECRVTVPSSCTVAVNGETLSEQNSQVNPTFLFEEGFLPEGVENPLMTGYVFNADSESPDFVVTNADGEAVTLTAEPDRERTWTYALQEDDAMRQQYAEAALSLGKKIAKFMSKDGEKKSITRMCLRKSPAWEIFDNLSNRYATPHKGIDFRNEAVTDFYKLSDTCFTCRVSFDYVLFTTEGERVYPTAYTFCIVNQDGKGGLYNLQIY